MAPLSILGALSALPLAFAHMQMSSPSPLRDPHATDRPDEPKDYNILSPLNADGSNFACKGYHLNTPLTTVATYEAGSKQTLRLKGSATHGGGSCQISLSCNKGEDFNVIKSIIGGCPLSDHYDFTVPSDLPAAKKCLLAWTWFNRIGNREMYMNCAVVDITNKRQGKRDTQISPAKALSRYPELFVANLANINSCKIQETTDVIFDNPGRYVTYGNGENASMQPSFRRGQCTGKPSKNAGSKDSSSSNYGGGGQGQWNSPAQSTSKSSDCAIKIKDGFYHPECSGGSPRTNQEEQQPAQQQQQQQRPQPPTQGAPKKPNKKKPNTKVQQELDAYLATLYGRGHARRETLPASNYFEARGQKKGYSVAPHPHIHGKNCKHKTSGYSPDSQYYNNEEDVNLYPEDDADYTNKDFYSNQDPQYREDADYAYKRVGRERRWISYNKRADVPRKPIKYYRGDESAYYVQQAPDQASTEVPSIQVLTDASKQASIEASAQGSTQAETQTPSESAAHKAWNEMTEAEKFDAFLRRMVELSTNMASLVKYAAASTATLPWYPPASTYDRAPESTDGSSQRDLPVRRFARRGILASARSPAQVYPGPSVGSISAPGDATDADDGFKAWFPHLVQGLVAKRQLVDPVTSEASAEAGDSVNFFDALAASFWKLFGDPFDYYSDDSGSENDSLSVPEIESAPDAEDIPLVLGEPDIYSAEPEFPDFDIPDLDGHYTFPPQIFAPEPPVPELLPGYEEGPDGPIWVGEEPDPLGAESTSEDPYIIISVEPIDSIDGSDSTTYPGEDVPTFSSCTKPIPQIGFNSCLGGCNHTPEEIAAHNVYLKNFAKEQAEFEECVKKSALDAISPSHSWGIWHNHDDADDIPSEAEDASGRHPRPGSSHPLIPYPLPDNFTGPYPSNATDDVAAPSADPAAPGNDTRPELLPYQNKTLGELVSEILENPDVLPSSSSEDDDDVSDAGGEATNPLQEAADQAEEGITVPQEPVEIDPNTLDSIADALPWFLGPGPVVTDDVPAGPPPPQA